jgi:hypothetical protein
LTHKANFAVPHLLLIQSKFAGSSAMEAEKHINLVDRHGRNRRHKRRSSARKLVPNRKK